METFFARKLGDLIHVRRARPILGVNTVAIGHNVQLTRQIGEHLVAAEPGLRGYVAAPFAGNVPMFDLMAAVVRAMPFPSK